MERGDVAVSDEHFGMRAYQIVIEQGQQTGSTIAAADANDRLHGGIQEHAHQVGGAFAIAAGKVTETFASMARELDLETEFLKNAHAVIDCSFVGRRTGRRDEADRIAEI